jgi:hypothetical protein
MTTITAPANGGDSSRDLATCSTATPAGVRIARDVSTLPARSGYSPVPPDGGVLGLAFRSTANAAPNTVVPRSIGPAERHRRYR